ncbi:MAG: hypothetical protein HUU55_22065 [Myxococcales bacterium]|nr:hypothetical protein [Myxococcales bacterium]
MPTTSTTRNHPTIRSSLTLLGAAFLLTVVVFSSHGCGDETDIYVCRDSDSDAGSEGDAIAKATGASVSSSPSLAPSLPSGHRR